MIPAAEITGIILAGGQSLRMGSNKALVSWKGKRLVDWVMEALRPLCSRIIISANEDIPNLTEAELVKDHHRGIGPAAGIEAGLSASNTRLNILATCDTPMLSTPFFKYMLEMHGDFEISIPVHHGVNEPLIGVYNRSALNNFREAISKGLYKPPAIIRSCNFQEVPVCGESGFYNPGLFLNINSREDMAI